MICAGENARVRKMRECSAGMLISLAADARFSG
eukprot:CAMPEP_0119427830 /NCGR_PEP_ID=MMETSP1335-20130426/39193_1 /TAXON_ID=259385 /ORGANISM="Chrysoculter rhomboideus, Strain RCC1486" /LENGTH=32 /DNA_ID= /DNA_START= /DNA_END= /DNA_ORIENTATION=